MDWLYVWTGSNLKKNKRRIYLTWLGQKPRSTWDKTRVKTLLIVLKMVFDQNKVVLLI